MDWKGIFFEPLQGFFSSIMEYLPYVIGALVLLLVAWILAKILRSLARKLVKATGIDKRFGKDKALSDKSQYPIAEGTGTVVFWLVWIFFILAILQVLGLHGALDSVVLLFERIFAALPSILAAVIVLVIFYLVARFVANLITKLLTKIRFDEVPVKLGLTQKPMTGGGSPSHLVGYLAMVFILLFAIMMAAELLGFTQVNNLVASFTEFLALVLLGLIIIGIGIFVANMVVNILKAGGRSTSAISLVRIFIIVLSIAIGLRAMGFANDIILLVFGLLLGAIAVAAAIAFGLGGRKTAEKLLERWTSSGGEKTDTDTH